MRTTGRNETDLVLAAQAGDHQAMDELIATGLPLVYTIARRALDTHTDADDVVQDTMLRAVRQLPTLHHPESFRPWLAAIAVHQVSTHLHRRTIAAHRAAPLHEAVAIPDADADIEDLTMLQLELSGQRRQVTQASRWLDPDDRTLLSLWWLETAGTLTRAELAATLNITIAHAAVRIQRMRQQLDVSREILTALNAIPRCPILDTLVSDWDGTPSPLWRKRIARHTRTCTVCGHTAENLISPERLLAGYALLPVPVALTTSLTAKTTLTAAATAAATATGGIGATVKAGLFTQLMQAVVAHPIAATVAAAVAAGAAVTVTTLPTTTPPTHGLQAAPSTAAAVRTTQPAVPPPVASTPKPATTAAGTSPPPRTETLIAGRSVSLEAADQPGLFVTTADSLGVLTALQADSPAPARHQATFAVLPGLADTACFSFRAEDGRYLRHASWRFQLHQDEGTALFRGDATFCPRPGPTAGSILLEAQIYPGWYLHHRNNQLWVDQTNNTTTFWTESSFRVRPALA